MSLSLYFVRALETIFSFLLFLITISCLILWPAQSLEMSFADLNALFPFVVFFSAVLAVSIKLHTFSAIIVPTVISPSDTVNSRSKSLLIFSAITFAITLLITALGIDNEFSYTWFIAATGSATLLLSQVTTSYHKAIVSSEQAPKSHVLCLSLCSIFLVLLYLLSNVNNADDTHFISYIVGLFQHPQAPVFSVDTIYNENLPNHIFALNLGQSWEFIIAALSYSSGINHLTWYYTIAPCIMVIFVPWVTYTFVRHFVPQQALMGTLFSLAFLLLWSTHNHMHGFFFIPRFFQGKALLLMLYAPLTCLMVLLWCRTNSRRYLIATGLAMIACGGVSSTGFYIGGLVAGISLLAFSEWNIKALLKNFVLLALVSLPNLVMLVVVKTAIADVNSFSPVSTLANINETLALTSTLSTVPPMQPAERPISSMYWLFGDNYSLFIILSIVFVALIVSYASQTEERQLSLRWLSLILILCFSHPLATFLGNTIGPGNLIWRFHWAAPLSLLIALSSALIIQNSTAIMQLFVPNSPLLTKNAKTLSYSVLFSIFAVFIALNGGYALQRYSSSFILHKVPFEAMRAAKETARVTSKSDTIIAQNIVAQMLPMIVRDAKLIASRPLYWSQPYFSSEETKLRERLQTLTDNLDRLTAEQLVLYQSSIKLAGITVIVAESLPPKIIESLSLKPLAQLDAWGIYRVTG